MDNLAIFLSYSGPKIARFATTVQMCIISSDDSRRITRHSLLLDVLGMLHPQNCRLLVCLCVQFHFLLIPNPSLRRIAVKMRIYTNTLF
jgi:hypothetical protein